MRKKQSGSGREIRHRISLYDVLNQAIRRYEAAVSLADAKAKERGAMAESPAPDVVQLKTPAEWRRLIVELVSVPCIVSELGKDQSVVSRRLKERRIQPIYYDGKTPLYTPDVIQQLQGPTTEAQESRPGTWQENPKPVSTSFPISTSPAVEKRP